MAEQAKAMKTSKSINNNKSKPNVFSNSFLCFISFLNLLVFGATLLLYFSAKSHNNAITSDLMELQLPVINKLDKSTDVSTPVTHIEPSAVIETATQSIYDPASTCDDPIWCNIPMPHHSYFKFEAPSDPVRWRLAQSQAASGEQVLLARVKKVFPNSFDFLDGDRAFRKLHSLIDVFADEATGLEPLRRQPRALHHGRMLQNAIDADIEPPVYKQEGENTYIGRGAIPNVYEFRNFSRAPILQIGYIAFKKVSNTFFTGEIVGGSFLKRNDFLKRWDGMKDQLAAPFITVCALNENWGVFSTMFPNRTAKWGTCCDKPSDQLIYKFLNHEKTLMFAINQHSNISHPKLITLPRGLPLTWEHTERMIWDSIQYAFTHIKKKRLLFASSSSWGKRPQMIHCISEKMDPADFEGHDATPVLEMAKTKVDRRRYYEKLGGTMFGVALPGLGYDCFRTWELLTMGSIPVLEKGVGLDRTLWRLPALLLDDFDDINPTLLRTAYVEALYRADDFEFERLTQSFWWTLFANVSLAKSTQPLLDKFPMEAEDRNFARPRVPFSCGLTNTCGAGTKRTPKKSC